MPDYPKISRQLAYQRRKLDAGLCKLCGQPARATLCETHLDQQRERMRKQTGCNPHQVGKPGRPPKK